MRTFLLRVFFVFVGLVISVALLTLLLMLFPGPVLGPTSYYERISPGETMAITYRLSDGDLFVALPGSVRPPEDDRVLEQFDITWDAAGFREPLREAERYPIAVFGDSFTEGFNVPVPWPDRLAENLDVPVRNYGYRAYGPREVARAAETFGTEEARTWMIYGYFSGNDLGDALRPPKIDTGSPAAVWSALFDRFSSPPEPVAANDPDAHYDFPMPVIIGGNYYEMVFLTYYLWWHLEPDEGFAASANFDVLAETLDTFDALNDSGETCHALVFIPTKEQLYYRYIYETERQWLRGVGHELVLDEAGTIRIVPDSIPAAEEAQFIADMSGQRDAVAQLVADRPGWIFVDLLPVFEAAVAEGELLYYAYDSHWNQAGHDLAAAAVADALRNTPDCPLR